MHFKKYTQQWIPLLLPLELLDPVLPGVFGISLDEILDIHA
jgi:hypothetical protein